jgi:hypothetical protein
VFSCSIPVMPLPAKCGEVLFRCTCRDCFTDFVCVESLSCSMLFDSQLKVPEKHSAIHLKDCEKAKLDNLFNAGKLKELEKKKEKKKNELVWAPSFEDCEGIEEGSAASMVKPTATARPRLEVNLFCIAVMREKF